MQVKQYKKMRYWEYLPDDFDENKKYPFLLYLHGAGERGEDMNNILNAGVPKSVAQGMNLSFIIIAPKCEDGHTCMITEKRLTICSVFISVKNI